MAHEHKKSEGGNKRGHSNMCHWMPTAEIKAVASAARRAATREARYVGRRSMDTATLDKAYVL
jgi:hypothetical protein